MRVLLTGGTGFIGGRLAVRLRERGDEVVALVRSTARATALVGLGCELVEGDLNDRITVDQVVEGVETVFHVAGWFGVGLPKADCPKMQDINIGAVRRIVDASIDAGVSRIVHVSSVNVFGDTKEKTVDETYQRDPLKGFLSCYDESKYRAHMLIEARARDGAPVVSVQPGTVYGPGDHFEIGRQILLAAQGKLPWLALADVGLTMAYVDDVVEGILLAHDKGTIGQSYVLGGETTRLREVLAKAAGLTGRQLPERSIPVWALRLAAPMGWFLGPKVFGYPPNFTELIAVGNGTTYWASDAKARTELGYAPRTLEAGLRETLTAAGIELLLPS